MACLIHEMGGDTDMCVNLCELARTYSRYPAWVAVLNRGMPAFQAAKNGGQYSARWIVWRESTMFPTGLQATEVGNKMITNKEERRVEVLFIPVRGYTH